MGSHGDTTRRYNAWASRSETASRVANVDVETMEKPPKSLPQVSDKIFDVVVTLKKTRRGQIRRVVRETYARDDIACGFADCPLCDVNENPGVLSFQNEDDRVLIVDFDVALNQLDFLCGDPCIQNCVFPSSVLERVRQQNRQFYARLRNLCQYSIHNLHEGDIREEEAATDHKTVRRFYVFANHLARETRVIRRNGESLDNFETRSFWTLALWYQRHCAAAFSLSLAEASKRVLVLTNSKKMAADGAAQGLLSMTVVDYVNSVRDQFPLAGEALSQLEHEDEDAGDEKQVEKKRRKNASSTPRYPAHLRQDVIQQQLSSGKLHKGIIRMDKDSSICGTVSCSRFPTIRILGYRNVNRAVDGDLVVVKRLCREEVEDVGFLKPDEDDDIVVRKETEPASQSPSAVNALLPSSGGEAVGGQPASTSQLDKTQIEYGAVVGILRRNWKEYAGSLIPLPDDQRSRAAAFVKMERRFRPWDARIPDIVINTRQSLHLDGKRLVVAIDSWNKDHRYPTGHWVHVLGNIDDPDVEARVIFNEYDIITREFSDAILRCLPPADYKIPPEEVARRVDLRDVIACSIDPPGCKDIDDALSCEKLPNGHYRVGVHIADVTHFVLPGTALDREAAQRCTTVYLVERRTDMLPSLLTTDLCSLVPGVDRLAFSVLWEMTSEAKILSTTFNKTVIRSRKALTYEEAHAVLEDSSDNSPLKRSIASLHRLACILRCNRMAQGALELASLEVKFQLDSETHSPNDVDVYHSRDTNKLVEEFMLLANSSVASFILQHLPFYSVLRRHPPPKEEHLKSLQSLLRNGGFPEFDYSSSAALANSLNQLNRPDDPFFNKIVRVLTTRCMNQALYVCSGDVGQQPDSSKDASSSSAETSETSGNSTSLFHHYGLAATLYTHFTSPIRRYADVLVHRLLAVALGLIPLPDQLSQKSLISEQCDQMNLKHRNAQWASRASIDFFTYRYFKTHGSAEVDALVTAVKKNGVQVQIPRFGIEGIIFTDAKKFEWSAVSQKLTYTCSITQKSDTIGVFDHLWVKIYAESKDLRPKTVIEFLYKTPKEVYAQHTDTHAAVTRENFLKEIVAA